MPTLTLLLAVAAALSCATALAVVLHRTYARLAVAEAEAATDMLTGLANRRSFTTALQAAVARGGPTAVALIDVDRLKAVNDHYGHQTGDHVLVAVAGQLANLPAPVALAARLSGDEFALLIGADPARARAICWQAWQAVATAPVRVARKPLAVRVSIGLAGWQPGMSPRQLLHRADVAMYQAKATTTGVCEHTPGMPDQPNASRPVLRARDLPHPRPITPPPRPHR